MRYFYFLFLLLSAVGYSQGKPLEIVIDSVATNKAISGERKFTIHYHLTNLTDKPISFLLATKTMVPIGAGSLNPRPYYKLFEGDNSIDANYIFNPRYDTSLATKESQKTTSKTFNEMDENELSRFIWHEENKVMAESMIRMAPNETKKLCADLSWNLKRYHTNDVDEYYINEKATHYIELSINLMKEHLQNRFTQGEYETITADKTFIKGWFTSNKMEIDLAD